MRKFFTTILLFSGLVSGAQNRVPGKVHFGLVYPLSTNGTHAPLDTNNLSLSLIAGVSAAERGAAFAGLANVVLQDVKGSLFAGFANHVRHRADGALFSGFANLYGGGKGSAFAGFANISSGDVDGALFSGFANIYSESKGSAFAGFANISSGDVEGAQFAGFINIAKRVKGAQIAGFINIADSSDCPVGIINIIKNGEMSVGLTFDETQTSMLSFRSGGKVLYGILGIGYNFKNKDAVYAVEAGLGAHFLESRIFRLNTEILSSTLTDFKDGDYFKASLRVMPAFRLAAHLELFGGPALHFVSTDTREGAALHTRYLKKWEYSKAEDFRALYLGYTIGLHIIF